VEFCEYGKELSGPVKYGQILDSLRDYSLLSKSPHHGIRSYVLSLFTQLVITHCVIYSDLPSHRYMILRIANIKYFAFCIKTHMAARRRNSDEVASHNYACMVA